jgi:predicted nucleic acid-binding protein
VPAFVIDASPILAWVMPDEDGARVAELIEDMSRLGAAAPSLLWTETRNILVMSERRRRLDQLHTARILAILADFAIDYDTEPDEAQVFRLARTHGLTIYDALYLDLALRRTLPLATLDRRLAGAAGAEGVAVLPAT